MKRLKTCTLQPLKDAEAKGFCTLSPSFCVSYFHISAKAFVEGRLMDRENYVVVMVQFATLSGQELMLA